MIDKYCHQQVDSLLYTSESKHREPNKHRYTCTKLTLQKKTDYLFSKKQKKKSSRPGKNYVIKQKQLQCTHIITCTKAVCCRHTVASIQS